MKVEKVEMSEENVKLGKSLLNLFFCKSLSLDFTFMKEMCILSANQSQSLNQMLFVNQELVRLLQQTLRTSQCERPTVRCPAQVPDSVETSDQPESLINQEGFTQLENVVQERDEQIKSLCGHMERLALEKESLQQELKGLKIKVGEINDQLGMMMETIQAKDEVIMKLSQESSENSGSTNDATSHSPIKDQQELDNLKVEQQQILYMTFAELQKLLFKRKNLTMGSRREKVPNLALFKMKTENRIPQSRVNKNEIKNRLLLHPT